jgi:hypothetical protein
VSKELDTSWFDLKKYEKLKFTPIDGWARLLDERYRCQNIAKDSCRHLWSEEEYLEARSRALSCLIEGYPLLEEDVLDLEDFQSSVKNLSLGDAWRIVSDAKLLHIDEWEPDALAQINTEPVFVDPYMCEARVSIDLSATDEQIKKDFNQWLAECREVTDIKTQKKLFRQADFDYWIEYRVIPYLDLVLVAKLAGKKITQNKLARLIFPDIYDVDIVERLRKVTKPLAEDLIDYHKIMALYAQNYSEKRTGMKST